MLLMNDEQKETLLAWLNDAHAMEEGLVSILEKQAEGAEDEQELMLAERIRQHCEETRHHAERIAGCIDSLGEKPSATKDYLSKFSAAINGLGMSMMEDAIVKSVHSSYAAEHFEIATYTLLAAAATACEQEDIAKVCDEIKTEEERMAEWLIGELPKIGEQHLSKLQ